jgi:hypothetical protein
MREICFDSLFFDIVDVNIVAHDPCQNLKVWLVALKENDL